MGFLEELGRRADRAEFLQQEYDKLYTLLCDLVTGAKSPNNIVINSNNKSWSWTPPIPKESAFSPEVLEQLKSRNGIVVE